MVTNVSVLPEPTADYIRLISIDPGTDTMGVCIYDINPEDFSDFKIVYGNTFKASQTTDTSTSYASRLSNSGARLRTHRKTLEEIFFYTQPTLICAESNFLKRHRVTAFEALVRTFEMLLDMVWNYSPSMYLYRIDPISAKNAVGVSHIKTDKEDVRRGVMKNLTDKLSEPLRFDMFDEHTIDACAIGYCFIRRELIRDIIASTKSKRKGRRRRKKK